MPGDMPSERKRGRGLELLFCVYVTSEDSIDGLAAAGGEAKVSLEEPYALCCEPAYVVRPTQLGRIMA